MDDPALTEELRAKLPELFNCCVDAAEKFFFIFSRYPDHYRYTNRIEFLRNFSGLVMRDADPDFERLKTSLELILTRTDVILTECISHKSRIGKDYFYKYKRRVVPYLDKSPDIYAAPRLTQIEAKTTELAVRWSRAVEDKYKLIDSLKISSVAPAHIDKIIEISRSYDSIYKEYDLMIAEMAKFISLRDQYRSNAQRNRVALVGLVMTLLTALIGVLWWKYGSILNSILKK